MSEDMLRQEIEDLKVLLNRWLSKELYIEGVSHYSPDDATLVEDTMCAVMPDEDECDDSEEPDVVESPCGPMPDPSEPAF